MENPKNNDPGSQLFLTGAILFANLDYHGLAEYALKALIGGLIWMSFKVGADFFAARMKRSKSEKKESNQNE